MLHPYESIATAKDQLLEALSARGLKEINGEAVSDNPSDIEFGVPVDRNDFGKGWTRLEADAPAFGEEGSTKRTSTGKKNNAQGGASSISLQAADLRNGQSIAFRFQKQGAAAEQEGQPDLNDIEREFEDPGWDVIVPSLDDYEEEEEEEEEDEREVVEV